MRISCPSCQSSYKIADEKVQGRTVKVRCRKCGMTIHVSEQGVMNDPGDASQAEAGVPDAGGAPQFSVLVAEGDQRDMGLEEIVAAYNSGLITAETFVWAEGQPDWMALGEIPAVVEALNAASAAVDKAATTGETAAAAPAPEPAPMPAAFAAPDPMPRPAPAPVAAPAPLFGAPQPVAAAPAPAPAPAPLFGAGPTAAVQASHEHKADLFSTQAMAGLDDDVATSAPKMEPVNKPTGTRDESSVLFSLSALTAASASTSTKSHDSAGGDDSGLIDLRALADQDANKAAAAAPAVGGGILDAAPLLGTPIVDPNLHQLKASEPPPAKSNTGMIVGIVVGALGILSALGVVVFFMTREPPAPAPVPVPTTEATDTPSVPTTPTPATDTSGAAAPATGAPSATAEPTKARPTGYGKAVPKTTGTSTTQPTTTDTAKKPPPKKNPCNCPPGDLACNMACAVK